MLNLLWQATLLSANLWAASGGNIEIFEINPFEPVVEPQPAALNGAVLGALIGNAQDQRDQRRQDAAIAAANAQAVRQMSLGDVVQMSQQKIPDQIIVNQLNGTNSRFDLRADDILYLREQGVSDYVISQMQVRRGPNSAPAEKNDNRTPILPPIKQGESPKCGDGPSRAEILRLLPAGALGKGADDVEFTVEKLVDRIDPPRFFPLIGPAQLHNCHWKCTVHFTDSAKKRREEVVYIDKDRLHLAYTEQHAAQRAAAAAATVAEMTADQPERCPYCPGGHNGPGSSNTLPPRELVGKRVLLETRTESGPPILSDIPYLSRLFRNVGWSRESVTILAPIQPGEKSDCVHPPTEAEILQALPPGSRDNVAIVVEKLVDKVDPPRFFPLIGRAQLHHVHWKCVVHFDEADSTGPKDRRSEVVHIDTDHLHLAVTEQDAAPADHVERCPYCPGGHNGPANGASPGSATARMEEKLIDGENLRRMHAEWRVSSGQPPLPRECGSRPPGHLVGSPDILLIESVRLEGKKPLGDGALKNICGEHLIRFDGTLSLGIYGSAYVAGMTVGQVKCVIEDHLKPYFVDPQVSVEVKPLAAPVAQTGHTEQNASPQVQIELIVVEVDPADLPQNAKKTGILTCATDFQAFLQQMRAKGKVKMLAQPRVTTWVGHEGWTQSGSDVEIKLPAGVGMPPRICRMFVGTEIKFLAKLKGGKIELAVHGALSDPDEVPSGATGGFDVPGFNVRSLDANAVLNDGQTLLMVADDFPPAQLRRKKRPLSS